MCISVQVCVCVPSCNCACLWLLLLFCLLLLFLWLNKNKNNKQNTPCTHKHTHTHLQFYLSVCVCVICIEHTINRWLDSSIAINRFAPGSIRVNSKEVSAQWTMGQFDWLAFNGAWHATVTCAFIHFIWHFCNICFSVQHRLSVVVVAAAAEAFNQLDLST